jgi:hypothetical protein
MTLGHLIIYFVKLPVFSGKMQRGEGGRAVYFVWTLA